MSNMLNRSEFYKMFYFIVCFKSFRRILGVTWDFDMSITGRFTSGDDCDKVIENEPPNLP